MSMEIEAFFNSSTEVTASSWQDEITRLGFPLVIDPGLDIDRVAGFQPAVFRDEKTGFECYRSSGDQSAGRAALRQEVSDRDACITFRWGGDLKEMAAAIGAAALLVATVVPRDILSSGQPVASPQAINPTPTHSASPSIATARPSPSDVPSSDFLGSAIDRALRVATGTDLRARLVRNAGPILADHPFLGVGPGRYGGAVAAWYPTPVYRTYGTDKLLTYSIGYKKFFHQQTVDNFWLHLVVESGILGTIAFAGLILIPIVRAARAARATAEGSVLFTAIVGIGVVGVLSSLSTMLLEANAGAFPFWLLLGIGWSIVQFWEVPVE